MTVDSAYMILNGNGIQTEDSELIPLSEVVYISHKETDGKHYVVWDNWTPMQVTVLCETGYEYLYGWWDNGDLVTSAWSGTKSTGTVQKDGKTYKKWELTVRKDYVDAGRKAQFILNNGSGQQTADGPQVALSAEIIITEPGK